MSNDLTMKHILSISCIGFLGLCLLFTSCKDPEEVVIREDKDEFSLEDQTEIGHNLDIFLEKHANNFDRLDKASNQELYDYLNTVLATIVNTNMVATRMDFDWEVIILKDDNVRSAFTIPGGKIYVYTGLLKMIKAENELFSVLTHELFYGEKGEIITAMKEEYGQLALSDLEHGTESWEAINIAETIHTLSYPENIVAQADDFVLDMICPFQYEARGLKSFLERANEMSEEIEWLRNRPRALNRLTIIETQAENCGEEELTFAERYEYHKNLLP